MRPFLMAMEKKPDLGQEGERGLHILKCGRTEESLFEQFIKQFKLVGLVQIVLESNQSQCPVQPVQFFFNVGFLLKTVFDTS